MLSERLQVLVDPERWRRLKQEAAARGTSVGALVREAIDLAFPSTAAERSAAAAAVLDAEEMAVPDVAEQRIELDGVRGRRG